MLQGLSTEAFARRSARRPWITIGLWVVTLVAAFMLVGSLLEKGLTTEFVFVSTPEPQKGVELIEELRGFPSAPTTSLLSNRTRSLLTTTNLRRS